MASGQQEPQGLYLFVGLWSWEDWTFRHPGSTQLPSLVGALGQNFSLWHQRQCDGAPGSCLRVPGGGAAELGDCWLPPLLPELLPVTLVLSFQTIPRPQGAPSQPPRLCRHLLI